MSITSIHFYFLDEYVNSLLTLHNSSLKAVIFATRDFVHNVTAAQDLRYMQHDSDEDRRHIKHRQDLPVLTNPKRTNPTLTRNVVAIVTVRFTLMTMAMRTAPPRFGCPRTPFSLLCVAHSRCTFVALRSRRTLRIVRVKRVVAKYDQINKSLMLLNNTYACRDQRIRPN